MIWRVLHFGFIEREFIMGGFGSFYKGEKKKMKREILERRAERIPKAQITPRVEIIGKGKDKK